MSKVWVAPVSRGREQPQRRGFPDYQTALVWLRRKLRKGSGRHSTQAELSNGYNTKPRKKPARSTSFHVYEDGELVLEVWNEGGQWLDRGKYACGMSSYGLDSGNSAR